MKRRLLLLTVPILFAANKVDSTEVPFELSSENYYQLHHQVYSTDFQYIPENLSAFEETVSYSDEQLQTVANKIQPNQKLKVLHKFVNQQGQLVFQLSDATYIQATRQLFFDDSILNHITVEKKYWVKKDFSVLSSPIMNEAKPVLSSLQAYQSIMVYKIVQTPVGYFAEIQGQGWINVDDLSEEDNRIEYVQEILDAKYQKENIAVYVKQLSSGNSAGINQEKSFYAASIAKLPILYYVQEQLDAGIADLKQMYQYTPKSMEFQGAYQLSGSGSLPKVPDNHSYSLEELINKTAKESDNVASNLLAYYLTNQFDESFYKGIKKTIHTHWDMVSRETTVEDAGNIMEAIYYQNGYVLESLLSTQFDDQRISKDISVPVAHKIGDADDVKHDVAIIYTDEPFVLSIFTDKSSYDEITQIANDIYGILK